MPSGWVTGEIAVGVNGDVYVLGKIATQGSAALKRLDAADGRVISTTPLPSTLFPGSQLFAYSAGLIIAGADVKYLDNDGNLAHRYDLPNGSVPIFSANADGGLFAGTFPQGPGGMCGLGDGSLSISKYTPTDGQVWNHLGQSTRRCNGYLQLTALPNGGVVGTFGTDGIESKELTALSSTTGDVLWTQTPHPPSSLNGSIQAAVQLKVDIKGQIAVSESFRFTCRNGAEICEGTQIEFRSGDSGEIFHPTAEFYKGDPDPNLYTSAGFNHLAIADGRAYLALHHSNGTPLTSTATDYPLVALDAPALGGAYPESVLISRPDTELDVTGPLSLDIEGSSYSPNPFNVVATISSVGATPAEDVKVVLTLAEGLHTSDPASVSLGTLAKRDPERLVTWQVTADAQSTAKKLAYSVTATSSNAGTTDVTRQLAVPALGKQSFKYVGLGDSFSSGEGVEPFFEPQNRCHRSKLAYSRFVEQPGFPGKSIYARSKAEEAGVQWGFQACSGAVTDNVLTTPRYEDPLPQLAKVRSTDTGNENDLPVDDDTDLVTITIGGNNVHFPEVLEFCYFSNDCTKEKFHGQTLAEYNRGQREKLSGELDKVYAQIHSQAEQAGVLVLGYPQLLPSTTSEQDCPRLAQGTVIVGDGNVAAVKTWGFSRTEQNYLRKATSELNQTIAARVEASGNPLAQFIPVDKLFNHHEVCGNGGEWINGVSPRLPAGGQILNPKSYVKEKSFHPNELGQRYGYAEAINNYVNQLPDF
jgi:hypothetical protein